MFRVTNTVGFCQPVLLPARLEDWPTCFMGINGPADVHFAIIGDGTRAVPIPCQTPRAV